MHIGFLTNEYPPLPAGGIGTSVRNLARALTAQGHRVTVLGLGRPAEFDDQQVTVRMLGHTQVKRLGWLLNRRLLQQEINRLVRHEQLDILEAPDWCGLSAGLLVNCPIVVRCNGSATYFAHLSKSRVRLPLRLAEALALRMASSVVAVSRYTANLTRRLFRLPHEIGVIPNGIDITQFPAEAAHEEADTLLYFGTLVRKKGVLDLGPIFSRLVETYPQARLRLVGRDAPDQQTGAASTWELLWQSFSEAARTRVEYLGPQPHDSIQQYIRQAAVCLFPSYAEAFPVSWLEAMACGKAIVAYDIGWAAEVIEPQRSGILIPAGDVNAFAASLHNLLIAEPQRRALGITARQRVNSNFTAEIVARQSANWYMSVLARGR